VTELVVNGRFLSNYVSSFVFQDLGSDSFSQCQIVFGNARYFHIRLESFWHCQIATKLARTVLHCQALSGKLDTVWQCEKVSDNCQMVSGNARARILEREE